MEEPLFKSGAEEFDAYAKKLGKKVNPLVCKVVSSLAMK